MTDRDTKQTLRFKCTSVDGQEASALEFKTYDNEALKSTGPNRNGSNTSRQACIH